MVFDSRIGFQLERRRRKVRIASIDGWTARQQRMRQGVPAVILQRPKLRIGLDLVAGASQNPIFNVPPL